MNFAKFLRTPFFYRTPPVAASDSMTAMRALRPWEKYLDWCIELVQYIAPPENANTLAQVLPC